MSALKGQCHNFLFNIVYQSGIVPSSLLQFNHVILKVIRALFFLSHNLLFWHCVFVKHASLLQFYHVNLKGTVSQFLTFIIYQSGIVSSSNMHPSSSSTMSTLKGQCHYIIHFHFLLLTILALDLCLRKTCLPPLVLPYQP